MNNNSSTSKQNSASMQNFQYFLVLDFEATCNKPEQIDPMEIIEFPVLMVNSKSFQIERTFHEYVKPSVHPKLSTFCMQLTGITQDAVDSAEPLPRVLSKLDHWMYNEAGLICPETSEALRTFAFASCGNWDIQMMLQEECSRLKLPIPLYLRSWINVKKSYRDAKAKWPKSQNEMLQDLDIAKEGREHSGVDDCKNLVKVMQKLAADGFVFKKTNNL